MENIYTCYAPNLEVRPEFKRRIDFELAIVGKCTYEDITKYIADIESQFNYATSEELKGLEVEVIVRQRKGKGMMVTLEFRGTWYLTGIIKGPVTTGSAKYHVLNYSDALEQLILNRAFVF